ncbi:MAG: site-2 protease family protein [Gemmatimonadota bacterium]
MRLGGIDVARIFGIRLRLDWSWFAVLGLLTWTFATFDFPFRAPDLAAATYWGLGFSSALLLFVSVLIHELAHALAARRRGIPVDRITLFIFGGVAEMRMEARRPVDEFALTVVGPLASLGLAGVFWLLGRAALGAGLESALLLTGTLARLNLILAVFNMVPAFPLDGGRILRSVLWQLSGDLTRATRWATRIGRMFGWLLIVAGAWMFVAYEARLAGAWAVFLGWFLAGAAASAERQNRLRSVRSSLAATPVSAIVDPAEGPVSAAISVSDLLRESPNAVPGHARLVERDGLLVGAVTLDDAAAVPSARRAEVPVFDVMTPLEHLPRLDGDTPLPDAAELLRVHLDRPGIVATSGEPMGAVTMSDLHYWIQRREKMDG